MADGTAGKRHDDRGKKLRLMIAELIEMGVVPAEVELDGFRIAVATYLPPPDPTAAQRGVLASMESAAAAPVRSYRSRAREELRRRVKETE